MANFSTFANYGETAVTMSLLKQYSLKSYKYSIELHCSYYSLHKIRLTFCLFCLNIFTTMKFVFAAVVCFVFLQLAFSSPLDEKEDPIRSREKRRGGCYKTNEKCDDPVHPGIAGEKCCEGLVCDLQRDQSRGICTGCLKNNASCLNSEYAGNQCCDGFVCDAQFFSKHGICRSCVKRGTSCDEKSICCYQLSCYKPEGSDTKKCGDCSKEDTPCNDKSHCCDGLFCYQPKGNTRKICAPYLAKDANCFTQYGPSCGPGLYCKGYDIYGDCQPCVNYDETCDENSKCCEGSCYKPEGSDTEKCGPCLDYKPGGDEYCDEKSHCCDELSCYQPKGYTKNICAPYLKEYAQCNTDSGPSCLPGLNCYKVRGENYGTCQPRSG